MKKWMLILRESDGAHFIWNGEGCVRVSPVNGDEPAPTWHQEYKKIPKDEIELLNATMNSRARGFTIPNQARYRIIARGEFKDL